MVALTERGRFKMKVQTAVAKILKMEGLDEIGGMEKLP
jgi:hypothetical protein